MRKTTPLAVRLGLATVYMAAATQLGATVDTIARFKDNDAHRQTYDDTFAKYEQAKLAFELEVQRRFEDMEARREFQKTVVETREATESTLSAENGAKITIATPKVVPLAGDYDIKIPVEPDAPAPYIAPPAPEARADFLTPGHELGKFLYQWSKDLT